MAINFPSAPNQGDSHTEGSVTWIYNGSAWDSLYQPTAKDQVGLGNVDNTSDEDKPVSTAQQAALDALTKDDVGLDNVDNTSDMNKPVSTAQQAAIDAAGGGSSFDQDLNTTDSPTFDTLTTTSTIATDVYTVDLGATGTVTAEGFASPSGVMPIKPADVERFRFASTKLNAQSSGLFGWCSGSVSSNADTYLGRSSAGVVSINAGAGSLEVTDLDATGTVTAGGFVGTPQTLTDAATITYDLADGHNAKVTLTADRTLSLPSNLAEGASGVLTITQDGTGGHALTLASGWFVSAGALADITALAANEQAQITWYAYASNKVNATILPLQ